MPRPSRRDHLIRTAVELFAAHGFHATGVDLIMERSGVSKKTLYKYFRSKDELILACLRHYDGEFRNRFMADVERAADAPEGRLLAVFDVAEDWFCQPDFFGCLFINAVSEYSEQHSPVREVSRQFKDLVLGFIRELAGALDVRDPEELARELALLFEGAIVTAQVSGEPGAARTAKRAAEVLIRDALAAGSSTAPPAPSPSH